VYNTSSNKLTIGNGSSRDVVSTGTQLSVIGMAVMQRFR